MWVFMADHSDHDPVSFLPVYIDCKDTWLAAGSLIRISSATVCFPEHPFVVSWHIFTEYYYLGGGNSADLCVWSYMTESVPPYCKTGVLEQLVAECHFAKISAKWPCLVMFCMYIHLFNCNKPINIYEFIHVACACLVPAGVLGGIGLRLINRFQITARKRVGIYTCGISNENIN